MLKRVFAFVASGVGLVPGWCRVRPPVATVLLRQEMVSVRVIDGTVNPASCLNYARYK
jgi:hypothetical protein